jgi:hypothetical protein
MSSTTTKRKYQLLRSKARTNDKQFSLNLKRFEELVAEPCSTCLKSPAGGVGRVVTSEGWSRDNTISMCPSCVRRSPRPTPNFKICEHCGTEQCKLCSNVVEKVFTGRVEVYYRWSHKARSNHANLTEEENRCVHCKRIGCKYCVPVVDNYFNGSRVDMRAFIRLVALRHPKYLNK